MPLEYYQIPDRVDAIDETIESVVSDKTSVNGTGFSLFKDSLSLFKGYGGIYVSADGTPPTASLSAATPAVITAWEAALVANKDVTADFANGKLTLLKAGVWAIYGGFTVEHNITTRFALDFKLNGSVTAANAAMSFRNNASDVVPCPLFGLATFAVNDYLEVQWESVVGGTANLLSAQFMAVRII